MVETTEADIAQPPLYRAKKGKEETYLKNEAALTEYLLSSGLNNFKIKGKENLPEADLRQLILNIQKLNSLIRVSSKKYDKDVLYYMLSKVADLEKTLADEGKMKTILADMTAWVNADPKLGITEFKAEVKQDEATGKPYADIYTVRYADRMTTKFNLDSLRSSEMIELQKLMVIIKNNTLQ
jgi:DNA gyrase subunit B